LGRLWTRREFLGTVQDVRRYWYVDLGEFYGDIRLNLEAIGLVRHLCMERKDKAKIRGQI